MSHETTINVRFGEVDPYGHVNHAVYAVYLEVARTEALAAVGLDLLSLTEAGYQLVITDLTLKYLRPALLGDTVTITTTVIETKRASSRWQQVVSRGDTVLVIAEVRAGVTDRNGRPTKPAPWLFEKLAPLLAAPT